MQYQHYDSEVATYDEYQLRGTRFYARGPSHENLEAGRYMVCLGAAQTFGRFCDRPFSHLLQDQLELPVLNLGKGGAGPRYFLEDPDGIFEFIQNSKLVVIQVLSGRSEDNSLFESRGLYYLRRKSDGTQMAPDVAYEHLLKNLDQNKVREIVEETRVNWVRNFTQLLLKIKPPKILFWFSTRNPHYNENYGDAGTLFGEFPQLVNAKMINWIKPFADAYVECVSNRGLPQPLISKASGLPTSVSIHSDPSLPKETLNQYYPSPEMHRDATRLLEPACRKLL